eukprot:scaffold4792_cov31-Cyclotella_meneghiniana.AAC.2
MDRLALLLRESEEGNPRQSCVDTLKIIFCNKDMPKVDYSNVFGIHIDYIANLLSTEVKELVELVDFYVSRMNKLDLRSQHNMSSLFESAHTLLHHESIELQESALSILSRLLELNNLFGKSLVPKYGEYGAMACVVDVAKYLDSDSDNTVRKACELLGFLFRYLDLKGGISQDIFLKWVNSLTKLSQGSNAWDNLFLMEFKIQMSPYEDLCSCLEGTGEEDGKQNFTSRIMSPQVIRSVATCLPITLDELRSCGTPERTLNRYGERLLRLIGNYKGPKCY